MTHLATSQTFTSHQATINYDLLAKNAILVHFRRHSDELLENYSLFFRS